MQARCFFEELELHRELTDLAFERRDLGLVFRGGPSLDFLAVQLTAVVLREPQLDQIRREAVLLL